MHRKDIRAIDAIKITEPFFCDASYNQIGKLGTLMVHIGVCNGRRDTCIHVPLCTLLLPLPTTTPTPPNTYHYPYYYPYSSPYLLPWAPPAFLEGWGQDRVHLTAKNYYRSVVRFRPIRSGGGGGGGGGGAHVASNTEYLNVLLEVGGPWGCPRPTTPIPPLVYPCFSPYLLRIYPTPPLTYYVYTPTPPLTYYIYTPIPPLTYYVYTPTPPLTYYSPGAWSEVTSKVTYVMMTNSLIHYCQSMKHIYMDTVYKLS